MELQWEGQDPFDQWRGPSGIPIHKLLLYYRCQHGVSKRTYV